MDESSGVGVLDKAALVLAALETGPASLAGLVQMTGLARPTAHFLARGYQNLPQPPAKIVSWRLPGRSWPGCVTSRVSPLSCTDARPAAVSVPQLLNVPPVFATPFRSGRCCRWTPVQPLRSCWHGKTSTRSAVA